MNTDLSSSSLVSILRALALFLESIGNPAPSTINGRDPNGICRPRLSLVKDIFQSTALPVNIFNSNLLASVAKQGAGLVNVFGALTTATIFSPSQLALNDTVRKLSVYTVSLWNIGNETGVYTLTHDGAALVTGKTANDDQLLRTPVFSADFAVSMILGFELVSSDSHLNSPIWLKFVAN